MSPTTSHALQDTGTMLRRALRRGMRYPVTAAVSIATPLVLLLLFVGVLGETMGAGLLGVSGDRGDYLAYVVPGLLLISVAGASQGVAIAVAMDMTQGIVDRFRTMAIWRGSVLAGHVVGNLIQTVVALVVVLAVAVALGYRPGAGPAGWAAVMALLVLVSLGVIWLAAAMGMASRSVESASNVPMFIMLLPFLGSGFVPTDTMPVGLRWFAEHQPFTPIMETLRALLSGTPVGVDGLLAVAWSVGLALLGYAWARRLFARGPTRPA